MGPIRVEDEPNPMTSPRSCDEFYRAEYRLVLGLAVVFCGDVAVAEELAQDSFLTALRRWERVSTMDDPQAWIRSVMINRSHSRFRRMAAPARATLRLGPTSSTVPQLDEESRLDLWRAVRQLPQRQAEAVALTYVAGLSRHEVAAVMTCSEETVKTHLSRARAALAPALEVPDDDD